MISRFSVDNLSDIQEYIHVFASLKSRIELVYFVRRNQNQNLIDPLEKAKREPQKFCILNVIFVIFVIFDVLIAFKYILSLTLLLYFLIIIYKIYINILTTYWHLCIIANIDILYYYLVLLLVDSSNLKRKLLKSFNSSTNPRKLIVIGCCPYNLAQRQDKLLRVAARVNLTCLLSFVLQGLDNVSSATLRPFNSDINTPRIDSYRFSMANLEGKLNVC